MRGTTGAHLTSCTGIAGQVFWIYSPQTSVKVWKLDESFRYSEFDSSLFHGSVEFIFLQFTCFAATEAKSKFAQFVCMQMSIH
jgi:hypothetical protein